MLTTSEHVRLSAQLNDFRHKVAVVTGPTSGIGLGIAEAFAKAGTSVVLNGFGERDQVEEIRLRLEKSSGVKEIGGLALFLCSDAAASITGPPLPVDGAGLQAGFTEARERW